MGKTSTINESYLKFIPYSELDKWYVSYYLNPYVIKSQYPLIELIEVIEQLQKRIKKDDYDGKLPVVSKISFKDGKIHLRDENKTGMDLYEMPVNQLLVSKINFHQGAVSINKSTKLVCSTHYQPYRINYKIINGQYLVSILRSNGFLNFLQYLRADGIKNEATYEFIGKLKIPLPPLEEQNHFVEVYNKRIKLAEQQEQQENQIEQDIENYLFDVLGIEKLEEEESKKGLRFVPYNHVERWAVDFLNKVVKISKVLNGKYEIIKLRELIVSYQYGLSEKASKEKIGPPILRMNNIFNSEIVVDNLKYINIDESIKNKYRLNKGDLLFNRTNSKELVGKTAIFNKDGEYTFASYLIRVVIDSTKANFNYINCLFNSTLLKYQKDLVSRQITGQANINAQEMQDFLFPMPPLKIQNEIANTIEKMKTKIKALQRLSDENRKMAIKEFEKEIFQ